MVFDCFMFSDELDLLEFRLRHLWDLVDVFVICESPLTFSGKHKELFFAKHSGRFAWATSKIRHLVCDTMIPDVKPHERWHNETTQRSYLSRGLHDAREGDTVVVGDIDEFPSLDAVEAAKLSQQNCVCLMWPHCYFLDRKATSFAWHGSCIAPYKNGFNTQDIRQQRTSGQYIALPDSGWHFSYMGGIEGIQNKLASFSHSEFDTPEYRDASKLWSCISEDRIFLDGIQLTPVEDIELPRVMLHARKTHPHLFHPDDKRTKSRIFDCFMFWKELDVLEIRLKHLYEHVDRFVIVEAPFTFTGKPKPLYFLENKQKFAWAMDKIEHVLVDFQPQVDNPWWNESAQRNNIELGLHNTNPSDIILISDVDEIPNIDGLNRACTWVKEHHAPATLTLDKCYYKLNNFMVGQEPGCEPHPAWNMFVISPRHHLRNKRPQELRNAHNSLFNIDGVNGWHFSFIGDSDIITEKIQAFSHTEYNTSEILEKIPDKISSLTSDVFSRGFIFEVKEARKDVLPDCVIDNLAYYRQLGLIA